MTGTLRVGMKRGRRSPRRRTYGNRGSYSTCPTLEGNRFPVPSRSPCNGFGRSKCSRVQSRLFPTHSRTSRPGLPPSPVHGPRWFFRIRRSESLTTPPPPLGYPPRHRFTSSGDPHPSPPTSLRLGGGRLPDIPAFTPLVVRILSLHRASGWFPRTGIETLGITEVFVPS